MKPLRRKIRSGFIFLLFDCFLFQCLCHGIVRFLLGDGLHLETEVDDVPRPDNGHNGAARGHLVHQDEPGEHDGRYRADEERLGLAGHAAAAEIAADVLFINGRVGEPGVQPLGAVGKAEGREQIERHRGQNGQCNADGAQRQADAAEGDKKRFFERMHDKGPFCVRGDVEC